MAAPLINTRYEIIETVPHGDTSPFAVSKARDVTEGRVVTLQVLPSTATADRAALRAAAVSAMRLEHLNITRVFDQGISEDNGDYFVASEYVRGITLGERIRRVAPFSLSVATDLSCSIVEALDYAHRAHVLHGDLRPQDVLLSPEGQVKVTNFAYERAASFGLSVPTVDGDLTAFGGLLFQMLTGTVPAPSPQTPPSPRVFNAGVPLALDGIVQKCLHPNPARRYADAASLLADLQAVRDALRSGRSLSWSPLSEKRAVRPTVGEATTITDLSPEPAMPKPSPQPSGGRARRPTFLPAAADELEDERTMRPARERSSPLGKIVAVFFVLAVLGVIGFSWYISKFLAIPNDVLVPNLVGKTYDDVKHIAQQQHFAVVEAGSDYSNKWPEDQIYQQDPLPGRTIKAGKEVNIYRSLGPRLLTVPNLVGTTRDRALRDLQDTGLPKGAITEDFSETVPSGIVLSQTPDKGAQVARRTAVSLNVSKGRQPPDVPADVQADAATPNTVMVHWTAPARADNYTVYRVQDGVSTPIAQGFKDTRFLDKGLTPDTSYTYTVSAANSAGTSGPSEPAITSTPAKVLAAPTLPGDTPIVTPPDASANTDPNAPADPNAAPDPAAKPSGRMRPFTVAFSVPRHPRHSRRVQIEVQDVTGTNLVYDETHQPGDDISEPVQAFGNKIIFRIFIDGKLVKQQTL